MKTQYLIAVAITIVLSLTAVTLVVWQARELLWDDPQVNRAPVERMHEPEAPEALEPSGESPQRQARNGDADGSRSRTQFDADIPECKWGTERVFDEQSGKDAWRCSLSSYWNYTTETLEAMAYADAEAARVLAHRVREADYPLAIQLALRSTALSGNAIALLEAQGWRPTVRENGDMDLSRLGQAYVLMKIADKINIPAQSRSQQYESVIRQSSDNPDATMRQLDDIVSRMIQNMRQIELDVTGQITIGENDDA